jgi:hypothetical protein
MRNRYQNGAIQSKIFQILLAVVSGLKEVLRIGFGKIIYKNIAKRNRLGLETPNNRFKISLTSLMARMAANLR